LFDKASLRRQQKLRRRADRPNSSRGIRYE